MKQELETSLDYWLSSLIHQLPLFLLTLGIVHVIAGLWTMSNCFAESGISAVDIASRLSIAITPFLISALLSTIARQSNPKVLWFRYRVFFPAVMTCAISLIFGWSIQKPIIHLVLPLLFILLVALLSFFDSSRPTVLTFAGVIPLLALVGLRLFVNPPAWSDAISIWILGFLMTLGMGVAEAWKVTARTEHELEIVPKGDTLEAMKQRNRRGTNIATSVLPVLVAITALHPLMNEVYTYCVICLGLAQYFLWFYLLKLKWPILTWTIVSVAIGFLLPLTMILGVATSNQTTIPDPASINQEPRFLAVISGILLFSLTTMLAAIRISKPWDLSDRERKDQFALLAGTTCGLLGLLIVVPVALAGSWPTDYMFGKKLRMLLVTYVIVSLIVAGSVLYQLIRDKLQNRKRD